MKPRPCWCQKCGVEHVMLGSKPPDVCTNPDCQSVGLWTMICPLLVPLPDTWQLDALDRLILFYLRISPE